MSLIECVFNHLVLPPKVPGSHDARYDNVLSDLVGRLLDGIDNLVPHLPAGQKPAIAILRDSLVASGDINAGGLLDRATLIKAFATIKERPLILYMEPQNAALVVKLENDTSNGPETVIFEAFETSPHTSAVLAAEGALAWEFPGRAAAIPLSLFLDSNFQDGLAQFLESASTETLSEFSAKVSKAGRKVDEIRDTPSPDLITQLLMTLLETIGSPYQAPVLRKRVRDNVNIDNAERPWRRHPFWLVLRVAIQRHLCLALGVFDGRAVYKLLLITTLTTLLKQCPGRVSAEMALLLKRKVCRRLAKLEMEATQQGESSICYCVLRAIGPDTQAIIESVSEQIKSTWSTFKLQKTRKVCRLSLAQCRASDRDFVLSLPCSGGILDNLLRNYPPAISRNSSSGKLEVTDEGIRAVQSFTGRYRELVGFENTLKILLIRYEDEIEKLNEVRIIERCIELAGYIPTYFQGVDDAYKSNPLEMSSFVLNLFDLWRLLDMYVCKASPFLANHHPIFTAELLDCLQLPNSQDVHRLQIVQDHLRKRASRSSLPDILSHCDSEKSFSFRAFNRCPNMPRLEAQVLRGSKEGRAQKVKEYKSKDGEYERLKAVTESIRICSCPYGHNNRFSKDDVQNRTVCTRCRAFRAKDAIKIQVHEDFLPETGRYRRAAIVFELATPQYLRLYRETTWSIIRDLAHPTWPEVAQKDKPKLLIKDFKQLHSYMSKSADGSLTLASLSKSFLQTHYNAKQVKNVDKCEDVIMGFGPDFCLYDVHRNIWVEKFDRTALTLEHVCGLRIPRALQSVIPHVAHPPISITGPSSYQLLANHTLCPHDTPLHEFSACQRLLFGSSQRWVNILVELGSANINFSNADIVQMLADLAVRAGPGSSSTRKLREASIVFEDTAFCDRLAEQIRVRLSMIKSNWRETHCMILIIVLSECLFNFGQHSIGRDLIMTAREITLDWIRRLRNESLIVVDRDATATSAIAEYAFKAAILCRRTFAGESSLLSSMDIGVYCEASIALHQNTPAKLNEDCEIKAMMIYDTRMVYRIDKVISDSIRQHPKVLDFAVTQAWPFSKAYKFSPWSVSTSTPGWLFARLGIEGSQFESFHTIHFNYLEGFLLLDSKPLGGLPMKIRTSRVVQQMFGNAHLQTICSNRNGMSHQLVNMHEGNEVYFGIRHAGKPDEAVVVQLRSGRNVLEFVPREVFVRGHEFDLPLKLRDEMCMHFLNYTTGCLEIRRQPQIWRLRPQDWVLDLRRRTCQRGRLGKISRLLSYESRIGRSLVQSFDNFERPEGLLFYLPCAGRSRPYVEVNRFELTFFVNKQGLLQDNKSNMEFDEDQDVGTLYGLLSKIVLRDVKDHAKRSVIVPLGDAHSRLCGPHVEITIKTGANNLIKFDIDEVLGRLVTPPEPALIYAKAYYHALTSFPIPDPLTSRTGMEEAFHILRSGAAQPWQALSGTLPQKFLQNITQLSPKREFYPSDQRRLQTVHWDPTLPATVQHDHLDALAQDLIYKSNQLEVFEKNQNSILPRPLACILRKRGEHERVLYEPSSLHPLHHSINDHVYHSRDVAKDSWHTHNVANITRCLLGRPFQILGKIDLKAVLQEQQVLGGFEQGSILACSLSKLFNGKVFDRWGQLVLRSINADPLRPYNVAFDLALLAYQGLGDIHQVLAAFARLNELKELQLPHCPEFSDLKFAEPEVGKFAILIKALSPEFERSRKHRQDRAALQRHEDRCMEESRLLAQYFTGQWPARQLQLTDEAPQTKLIKSTEAFEAILETWNKVHHNHDLILFISNVQAILDRNTIPRPADIVASTTVRARISKQDMMRVAHSLRNAPTIPDLGQEVLPKATMQTVQSAPILSPRHLVTQRSTPSHSKRPQKEGLRELGYILKDLSRTSDSIRRSYGEDLLKSLAALEQADDAATEMRVLIDAFGHEFGLQHQIFEVDKLIQSQRTTIFDHFGMCDDRYQWLRLGDLWPDSGTVTLLEQLRSSVQVNFGPGVKEALVDFGLLITLRQWLGRVRHEYLHRNARKLQDLLQNTGHENWSPVDRPDWLLMEIEADLLIRPRQVDVAHQLIHPSSQQNSLTQLMMGEGKTSCIVPMAIAMLADGSQITRLIVPKALLTATGQTLQSRIGGLVGRRVCHIPFSRRTPSTQIVLDLYSQLHEDVRLERGVLLTTTDHILSFKLSGLQRLSDEKLKIAKWMISFQQQLDYICRDIIDESDLTLGVKTQLIYPSGPQIRVDGAPYRWEVAESLLDLVDEHLGEIQARFPQGLEITRLQAADGFPMAHFLTQEAEDELHRLLIDDVCKGRASFLRPARPDDAQNDFHHRVRQFLEGHSNRTGKQNGIISEDDLEIFADKDSAPKILLLIRGLLMNRILLVCLKKRWSVQYGIHPNRDPLAVPFEAKGVPSEQAEFGHPEVSIILTILSFYFAGLTKDDFHRSLKRVLETDDPAAAYDRFTHTCHTLPDRLRYYYVINIDDKGQVDELYSHLRLNRNILNYYLNNFVFPLHAKQFAHKLSSSSWDIPKMNTHPSTSSKAITTGFSGTNDIKSLLPLNIRQDDLPSLRQTNAEVLGYLLQERNRRYYLAADMNGRLTEEALLLKLRNMRIRIFLDAGAYILEMTNRALVNAWLVHDYEAKAAVYFDKGRAWVMSRNARAPQPLLASPWKDGITGDVLVFFDEANCRGIDLKLPPDARAALTLALNQTKDHTVQAAMRLRELAATQSIIFMAPPEVDRNLRDICGLSLNAVPDSSNVVKWLLEQTCRTNESLQNLHLAQGNDFCKRKDAQLTYSRCTDNAGERGRYLKVIMQEERQDLEQLYGPATDCAIEGSPEGVSDPGLKRYMAILTQKRNSAGRLLTAHRVHSSALEEVEQEREVAYEVQEIRQPEKPIFYQALTFPCLHHAIEQFARTGILQGADGYMHAFESLRKTVIGKKFNVQRTGSRLYCSVEFSRSVNLVIGAKTADNFLRPVEWILWSPSTETGLLIIPEEAELLIPILRLAGPITHTYLITYAAPVTKNMAHFNSLKYFTIPPLPKKCEFPRWFRLELGLFAGRLYASFDECLEIAEHLKALGRHGDAQGRPAPGPSQGGVVFKFSSNPIGFLLEWLALRRQVQDILQTPMGYICKGSKLHPDHPFFRTRTTDDHKPMVAYSSINSSADTSNESNDDHDYDDDFENLDDDASETTEEPEHDEAQDKKDDNYYHDYDHGYDTDM